MENPNTNPKPDPAVAVSLVLQDLASFLETWLSTAAGQPVPFVLALQVDKVAQYVSNTERADGIALLRSLFDRWEDNRADIPAHYNPDLQKP